MIALYDVDTQNDFMLSDGKLSVPGADKIIPLIVDLIKFTLRHDVLIIGSVDSHDEDDPEFNTFPPHCIKNTIGQEKIKDSNWGEYFGIEYVSNDKIIPDNFSNDIWQIYFEKQGYDIWDNDLGQPDNLVTVLESENITNVYVIGVATDICVLAAVTGFIKRGYNTYVISDAIKGLADEKQAIHTMKDLGAVFITSEEYKKIIKE